MRTYRVSLADNTVGSLIEATEGSLFVYDKAYIERTPRPVLSQSLLNETGSPTDFPLVPGLIPFFANLLPDKGPLRRYIASRQEVNPDDDFALLSALGRNLPGAALVNLVADEGTARKGEAEARSDGSRVRWRFSLAGVQMKFSATRSGDQWTVGSLDQEGDWIVKLGSAEYAGIVENEYAVMSLARDCGLNVPDIELIDVDAIPELEDGFRALGPRAYAIRRFDRSPGGRIHQEDMCQVFGQVPQNKYGDDDPRNTAERVLEVMRVLCPPEDVREWLQRLAFTIAVGNGDSHLKNHAIIYPNGNDARLSPLYDVVCTLRYERNDHLALPVAGNDRFTKIDLALLDQFADLAHVSPRIVRTEFAEMTTRLHDAWPNAAPRFTDNDTRSIVEHGIHHRMALAMKGTAV